MLIRRTAALALAALALGACKGDSGAGPEDLQYDLGIISGNHQVSRVGEARLAEPVVGRLVSVRLADGSSRLRLVTPLYAQTVVKGSPVPGAVVCAEDPLDDELATLVPEVRCTNTDANGQATFWFRPGTKAGQAVSLIKGTIQGQVEVFDSVMALVQPGPIVHHSHGVGITGPSPLVLAPVIWPQDKYRNPVYGTVDLAGHPALQLAGPAGEQARTLVATGAACAPIRLIVDGEVYAVLEARVYRDATSGTISVQAYAPGRYYGCDAD